MFYYFISKFIKKGISIIYRVFTRQLANTIKEQQLIVTPFANNITKQFLIEVQTDFKSLILCLMQISLTKFLFLVLGLQNI